MKKEKSGGCIFIIAVLVAALSIPAGILSYVLYFAWDSQIEGNNYKIAFEKDGQLYEFGNSSNGVAFDNGTSDDHLYTNQPNYLGDVISLSYQNYETQGTNNPFFAGKISLHNSSQYVEQQTKYINPKDSVQSYIFYDQNRNQILTYEPETANEYVVKLRPTFPTGSKTKYRIYNKRDYLDITKILKEKLNKNLKLKIDEPNKILILSFEN